MTAAIIMLVFTLGCWQSAQAFTAGTSPPGGPETQLPSDVSNVKNGPEFVAAFANPSVRYLRISSPEVNVLFSDWGSGDFKPPLVLKRDIVIEGNPEMPYWPTINLRDAPGVVRMAHNVTMTVRHVFASGFRDNPTRAPGLDFLLPTLQGEIAYLLVGPAAGNISLCFPNDFQILDFGLLEQMGRPSMFPGRNEIRYNESQEGCTNDTSVPPMRQCWPQKTRVVDLAAEGADYDITRDMNTPNGLMIHLMNLTLFCDAVVDPKCLKKGEPLVCYLEARKKYLALRGGSQQQQQQQQQHGDGDLTGAGRLAVICTTTIAGTLLLVVAGLLAVAGWRRCRQQRRGKVYEDSDGEGARCGAIPCRGDDDTKDVEPRKAAAPVIKRDEQTGVTFGEDHELHAVRHEQKLSAPAAAGLNAGKGADLPAREKSLDGGGTPKDAPGKKEPSQLLAAVADDEATEELKTIAPKNGVRGQRRVLPVKAAAVLALYEKPLTPLTPPHPGVVLDVRVALAPAAHVDDSAAERRADSSSNSNGDVKDRGQSSDSSGRCIGGTGDAVEDGSSGTEPPTVELLPVVLGKGGFGRVVEGLYGGRRVAVKLLASDVPFEVLQQQKADSMPNNFLKSFEQEMQVLSRCQHPNVVQLLAACVTPPRLCLVMELMETSLERLMYGSKAETLMPLAKVLYISINVANALAYLHPTVVHRDLKPANVLMNNPSCDWPVVKLSDFGLSRLRVTVKSTKAPDAGTPPYMPPECFDVLSKHVTHQVDIYSLGVLIWEMLAGKRPWEGVGNVAIAFMVTYKGLRLSLDDLPSSRCPAKLCRLLKACWESDPARRPAAAEVAKELTLVLEQLQ